MKDRTAFIVSGIIHLGVLLFFTISLRASLTLPQRIPSEFMKVDIQNIPQPQNTNRPRPTTAPTPVPTKKPEPTKVQPTAAPTKPKVSEDTIRKMQNLLKTPTPKKTPRNTPTPAPTRALQPTPTPTPESPAGNALSSLPKMPLSQMNKLVSSVTETLLIQGSPDAPYDFASYGFILSKQLQQAWIAPNVRPPELQEYRVIASFVVSRNGSVSDIGIAQSSGWPLLDETVLQAIQKASPVEPLPIAYTSTSIQVVIPFILPIAQ